MEESVELNRRKSFNAGGPNLTRNTQLTTVFASGKFVSGCVGLT